MKIKEVCRRTGLTERTVRYWASEGLISPATYELNERTYFDFTEADIALLGLDEARALLGTDTPEAAVEALRAAGVRYIAVKDGGNGAWAADETETVFVPPVPCRCIDPVGAGDAFNAGFLAGLLEKKPLADCAKMGAAAGAMATETPGDIEGCPDRARLDAIFGKQTAIYR